MAETKDPRLGYGDFLRCLSALLVVIHHCAGATLTWVPPASARFAFLNLLAGTARCAVPLFVMLSGMFLLDPDRPMPKWKWLRHVGRMALLTLIWVSFYALWDARGAHIGLEWLLEALISLVTGRLHYHLWFLPMLLGLYLALPLLRAFVKGASRATLWYAIGFWGVVAVCLGSLYKLFPGGLFHSWLIMMELHEALGYAGYFLLGYVLKTCSPRPGPQRALYILGAVSLPVASVSTQLFSLSAGSFLSPLYDYLAPNIALACAAMFLLARRLELGKRPLWAKLSPMTLGLYLLHPLLIEIAALLGFPSAAWGVVWSIPAQVLLVVAVALLATWLLRRIPKLGQYIC